MSHTHHIATDRRFYNGSPCSDLNKEFDLVQKLKQKAERLGAHCTYFPMEGKWSVWVGNDMKSAMYDDQINALVEFLEN